MAYPISDVPRRIVYSGSAGVGPYAFTFEVLTSTDIAVYKNSTLLTLTTDYTVSINSGTGTGNVTLVVAATGADSITIVGDRAIQRSSDFVTGGDLFANTLNDELDSLTIYAQQVDEKADRAVRAPVTDPTTINMVLPPAATRANKYFGFDGSGNPTATSGTDNPTVISTALEPFVSAATLADARTVLGISDGAVTTSKIADGAVTTAKWASANGQLAGMRNKIINGNFAIQQRATPTLTNAVQYGPDRWLGSISGGTGISGSFTRSGFSGSSSGFGAYCAGASFTNGQPYFEQRIEAANTVSLNGKTVTVSGLLYQDTGSSQNFTIRLSKANSSDNFGAVTLIADSTAVAVPHATVTSFSRTFTLGASDGANGIALVIFLSSAATVTSKNFAIADIQLEVGGVATPFEHRPIGVELALCQRYYEKSYAQGTNPGAATANGMLLGPTTDTATNQFTATSQLYRVEKRAAPTARYWDIAGNIDRTSTYTAGGLVRTDNNNNLNSLTATTSGFYAIVNTAAANFFALQWEMSAEL